MELCFKNWMVEAETQAAETQEPEISKSEIAVFEDATKKVADGLKELKVIASQNRGKILRWLMRGGAGSLHFVGKEIAKFIWFLIFHLPFQGIHTVRLASQILTCIETRRFSANPKCQEWAKQLGRILKDWLKIVPFGAAYGKGMPAIGLVGPAYALWWKVLGTINHAAVDKIGETITDESPRWLKQIFGILHAMEPSTVKAKSIGDVIMGRHLETGYFPQTTPVPLEKAAKPIESFNLIAYN